MICLIDKVVQKLRIPQLKGLNLNLKAKPPDLIRKRELSDSKNLIEGFGQN